MAEGRVISYEEWLQYYDQYGPLRGKLLSDVKTKVGMIKAGTIVTVYSPMFNQLNVTVGSDIRKRGRVPPEQVEFLGKKQREVRHDNQLFWKTFLDESKLDALISALTELKKNSKGLDTERAAEDLVGILREYFGNRSLGDFARQVVSLVAGEGGYYDIEGLPVENEDINKKIDDLLEGKTDLDDV